MPDARPATGAPGEPPEKRKKDRSPSFPFINLETAIARAGQFYKVDRKHETTPEVAAQHWNYAAKSSGALQTMAALKSFGLMNVAKGRVRLTERALRILLDERPDSEERQAAIKEAALSPRIHMELWQKYGPNLPSEPTLRTELRIERHFPDGAIDRFIKEYTETIAFAKLSDFDKMSPAKEGFSEKGTPGGFKMQTSSELARRGAAASLSVNLPLPRDNYIEIRLRSKMSEEEFKKLSDLLRFSLVGESTPEN